MHTTRCTWRGPSAIYEFSASGKLGKQIAYSETSSGIGQVRGLAIDHSSDLVVQSVAYSEVGATLGQTALFVYPSGSTSPSKTLPDPSAAQYYGLAIGAADTVYEIANIGFPEVSLYSLSTGKQTGSFSDFQTGFDIRESIAADSSGKIYVASRTANTVDVFSGGSSGKATPLSQISDYSAATLSNTGISVDASNTVFVSSCQTDSVSVYPAGASTPSRVISGPTTRLFCPHAVATDAGGNLYVEDVHGISVFGPGASGNVAPGRQILGSVLADGPASSYTFGTEYSGVMYAPAKLGAGTSARGPRNGSIASASQAPSLQPAVGPGGAMVCIAARAGCVRRSDAIGQRS